MNIIKRIFPYLLIVVLFLSTMISQGANVISITNTSGPINSTITIEVAIANDNPFVAFQLDIPLPAGFSYVNSTIALNPSRSNGHTIAANVISGNTLRIISYSGANANYLLNTGTIATFNVTAPSTVATHTFNITNPTISSPAGVNIWTSSTSGVVSVIKATPTVTVWPTASAITYGQALSASTLTGGTASVAGNFTFTAPTTTPNAGTYNAAVTFTPTDATNYNTIVGSVNLTVNKASATVTITNTSQTYNGTPRPVTVTTIPAGLTVTTTYDGSGTAPTNAGSYAVVSTISETNYQGTSSTTLTINKANPTVTIWPSTTAITFGQALSVSTISGGVVTPAGTFAFTTPSTVPISAGTYAASVTFTPTDASNYNTVVGSVNVTVNKAIATVTISNTTQVYNGSPRSVTVVTNPVGLTVTTTYNGSGTAPTNAGSYAVLSTINETNYEGSNTATLTISKVTPTVSDWPTSSAIIYGQALSASTLTAGTASIGGSFAFTTPSTVPASAGTYAASVTFTPTDATNYNTVTGNVNVTVNKTTATVTISNTAQTYNGSPRPVTVVTSPAGLTVNVTYNGSGTAPTNAGSYAVVATINEINYQGTNSATLTVSKVTPTVSAWPTASAITYGQALSASTLTTGSGSVAGTFAFTAPATTPNAGTYSASVTFTPTDVTNYNTVTGIVNVTVNKATPTVSAWPTASAITYGQALSASTLTGGTGSVAGTFAFTAPAITPNAGTYSASVTFTPTDVTNYNAVVGSVNVTVNKATPTVSSWPTASAITYGEALSASTLTGGTGSVAGTFAFTAPATTPNAGTYSASVTFTPTDASNYNTVVGSVNVTVNKATPTVSAWPTASTITYGQALSASTLTGGTGSVAGTFAYTAPAITPNAGTYAASVTFTPTDASNYNTVVGSVNVTVNKAMPAVSAWPTASAITYGQALSASTLTGGTASVAGAFAFTSPSTVPSAAGVFAAQVTFTPTDGLNYNNVTSSVNVAVSKATATVSIANTTQTFNASPREVSTSTTPSGLTVNVTYNGSATAPTNAGSYSVVATIDDTNYEGSANATLVINKATAGISISNLNHTYDGSAKQATVTTTPLGLACTITYNGAPALPVSVGDYAVLVTINELNYQGTSSATLVINDKVTPVVSWPTASSITYGQTLSVSTLTGGSATDGGSPVAGSFAFENPSVVLAAGLQSVEVKFTPTNTALYNSVIGSVNVTVNKATATVSIANINQTYNGDPRPVNVTTSPEGLSVSVTYSGSAIVPTNAGTYSVVATIIDDNYQGTNSATLTVSKATPTVSTWPAASAITYGQALSLSTLTGGSASVAGTFAYTVPATTPNAGTYSASIAFTPTDASNYNTVVGSVNVTVNKTTPTVSVWPTTSTITYGQVLSASTLTGGTTSVAGTFTYTAPATTPNAGTYAASVTFTPTDASNYNTVVGSVNVTVNKATPTVSAWPSASAITYGQALSASTLTGGTGSVAGAFVFTAPATTPNAGTYAASVTFTPTDASNYNTVVGSVNVTVNKATPTVSTWPTASAITYGQALSASTLTGGTGSVAGNFTFTAPATTPNAGTYSASVTFTPTDVTNYNTVTGSVNVTVNKATPTVSAWPTASAITYGQTLSASTLTGGTFSPTGAFVFTNSAITPDAGVYTASVTFTPADASNYNTMIGSVNVTVNKAAATVTITNLSQNYTGSPRPVSVTTNPELLSVIVAYNGSAIVPTNAGSYAVVATISDDNYQGSASETLVVSKLSPSLTGWPNASDISYGQTLSNSSLTGGSANVAGTFAFTEPTFSPEAGTYVASVIFNPNDAVNYNTVLGTVNVIVNKATPAVSEWPTASSIVYGNLLSASTLTGGAASTAGAFSFENPSLSLNAGTQTVNVVFTPNDLNNYVTVVGTVSVIVEKATATVALSGLARVYNGSPIDVTVTTTPANLIVYVTYNGSATAPTNAGSYSVLAIINEQNYQGEANSTLVINKANSIVSEWPNASAITYGQLLSASMLSGGSSTPAGQFAFTNPNLELAAGTHSVEVTFTPTDEDNYNVANGNINVVVNKANATVTLSDLSLTFSGNPLMPTVTTDPVGLNIDLTFDGTADVPVNAGTYDAWAIIADDNYVGSANSSFEITKAVATVAITNLVHTFDGSPKEVTITTSPANLNVVVTYNGSISAPSEIGEYEVVATVVEDNYMGSNTATLTINDLVTPEIEWPVASSIIYGQTVSEASLTGGSATADGEDVAGSFSFDNGGETPNAGDFVASVTFTPENTALYNVVTGTVTVVVEKATPNISEWPAASNIELGQALSTSILSGGSASVEGSFAFVNANIIPDLEGTYMADVVFTPTDELNYNSVTEQVEVMVTNTTPFTYTVIFTVTDGDSPVEGASVELPNGTLTTNAQGIATVELENGHYNYTVTATGFFTTNGSVTVNSSIVNELVILSPVSVNFNSLANLMAYPNPFRNVIHVTNTDNLSRIVITNVLGKVITEIKVNASSAQTIETVLPSGIYMVTFIGNDGSKVVKKMIRE